MIRDILSLLKPAAVLLGVFTALTGVLYPFLVTGVAATFFPKQAEGSLIRLTGRVVGSRLIGQSFRDPKYFWSRPSATTPPYNAAVSAGSNLGPTNPERYRLAAEAAARLRLTGGDPAGRIPVDLVTASGSGLDPHISPAAAACQVLRVAGARGVSARWLQAVVDRMMAPAQWGVFGEARVNVLELNLELDRSCAKEGAPGGQ